MKFGDFELFVLSDGKFKLDGGAMFGVVPKVLWEKTNPPNEMNRIEMGLNSLLIKTNDDIVLVDTGIGENYDEKFFEMFEIDKSTSLLKSLNSISLKPDDITKVVLTHLHFDHCGGNCSKDESGELKPTFPNATYYFQQDEFEYAKKPDPRSRGSYLAQNWQAIEESDQLQLISGNQEIVPGVEVFTTGGHTQNHQIVKVHSDGKTACFLADLVPTDSHLKTAYVMGYDLYPKTTMEMKEKVLKQALQENWLLIFEHAPSVKGGYLTEKEGKLRIEEVEI
ncbi:MBL fold metallo-hydrolase [candidate division KSB1 bacterium]|nr:MBL fold metallo-hydrolase [candidate division KSB1 bacterium]